MHNYLKTLILMTLATVTLLPQQAYALSSQWQGDNTMAVRLISGVDSTGQEGTIPLGIEVRLAPEWRTFWRSSGDIGEPLKVVWNENRSSGNLKHANLLYPVPTKFSDSGTKMFGYANSITFPVEAELLSPANPLDVSASVTISACNIVCIPKHFELQLHIPAGRNSTSQESAIIETARSLLPADEKHSQLKITNIEYMRDGLQLTVVSNDQFHAPDVIIESPYGLLFKPSTVKINDGGRIAVFVVPLESNASNSIDLKKIPLTITVLDGENTLEKQITAQTNRTSLKIMSKLEESGQYSVIIVMFLALLGGIFLNIMPGVLPIFILQIFIKSPDKDRGATKTEFLSIASGILFLFSVAAIGSVIAETEEDIIGWGIQFHSPTFLLLLTLATLVFALKLLGCFDSISLPPLPTKIREHRSTIENIGIGILSALLSTPYPPPFLSKVMNFSQATDAPASFIALIMLGVGMASPFALIAWHPELISVTHITNRQWKKKLHKLLVGLLSITTAWLMLVLFSASAAMPQTQGTKIQQGQRNTWVKFNETEVSRYVKEGKTVFVYVTANWCLQCRANELLTLGDEEIIKRLLNSPDVIPMQADWSKPDPVIAYFLQRYGKHDIPFSVVFGPNAPSGIILPELLTNQLLLNTLEKVRK